MAGETNQINIQVVVDTSAVKPKLDEVNKAVQATTASVSGIGKSAEDAAKGFNLLAAANVALGNIISGAVTSGFSKLKGLVTETLPEMIKMGEQISFVTDAFTRLEGGSALAEQGLQKLRTGTQGLVSDFELMKTANQGLLLGLDPRNFEVLANAATRLGQAVGRDASSALNDLLLGMSRGSPRILDNIGIVLKADEAYRKFAAANGIAADKLTDSEKKLAVQQEAMVQAAKKAEELGPPIQNAGTAFHQLGVDVDNAYNYFSNLIANSTILESIFSGLHVVVTDLGFAFEKLANNSDRAQLSNLQDKLASARGALAAAEKDPNTGQSFTGSGLNGLFFNNVPTKAQRDAAIKKLQDAVDDYQHQADAIFDKMQGESFKQRFIQANDQDAKIGAVVREGDAERAKREAERAAKEAARQAEQQAKAIQSAIDSAKKKAREESAKADEQSDIFGLQEAIRKGDQGAIGQFATKIHDTLKEKITASLGETFAKGAGASKIVEDNLSATVKVAFEKAMQDANQSIAKSQAELLSNALKYSLEDATKKGDLGLVKKLQDEISSSEFTKTLQEAQSKLLSTGIDPKNTPKLWQDAMDKAYQEAYAKKAVRDQQDARHLEELQKTAFNNSVSFFADLMSSAIDGTGKDLEKTLLEAGKRIAVGFASQMAANLAQKLGLGGLGNLTSAQGLGQSLAATLGFGGGSTQTLGEAFGLTSAATALDGSAIALVHAAAALTASAGANGVPGVPKIVGLNREDPIGLETIATKAGITAAVAVAAAITGKATFDAFNAGQTGGPLGGAKSIATPTGAAATFASFGLNIPLQIGAGIVGSFFGDSKASQESDARDALLSSFKDKFGSTSFNTVGGVSTLNPKNFNAPTGDFKNNKATQLAQPLAEIFTGGQGKGTDDLTGIFAHSLNDAKNFNEELLNTASLLDKMGTNAKDAEQTLFQLFKDGKISQNQFADGLQNLETVAQDTFQGPNGIAEGFQAINDLLTNGTNGGLVGAVKGLSTEMNTFAKQGLKTTKEVADYFAKAGDTVHAKFFQLLSDQGYKTAEDLANALNDPNLFNQLLTDLQNAGDLTTNLGSATSGAASSGSGAMKNLQSDTAAQTEALRKQQQAVQDLISTYDTLNGKKGGGGGGSDGTSSTPASDGTGDDSDNPTSTPSRGGNNKTVTRRIGTRSKHGG